MNNIKDVANYIIYKNPKISYYNLNRTLFLIWLDYYKKNKEFLFDDFFVTNFKATNFDFDGTFCYMVAGALPIGCYRKDKIKNISHKDKKFLDERIEYYSGFYYFDLIKKIRESIDLSNEVDFNTFTELVKLRIIK